MENVLFEQKKDKIIK